MKSKYLSSIITYQQESWHRGFIQPFWSKNSYTKLDYKREPFNNIADIKKWRKQGYSQKYFTGLLCDMNSQQPKYVTDLMNWFSQKYNLKNIGISFYEMPTGVILPIHKDTFKKYRSIFKCRLKDCMRSIVFLDKWQPGHFFEIDGHSITNYRKGDYICWRGDTPHSAANIGLKTRYTMQLTGHK